MCSSSVCRRLTAAVMFHVWWDEVVRSLIIFVSDSWFYVCSAVCHTEEIFYKTLSWDFSSLLTLLHFVLQYLPKMYISSPSPFSSPASSSSRYSSSSLLSICSSVASPGAPRRGRSKLGGRCWRRSGGGERRPRGGFRMRRPTGRGWWRRRWRWERNTSPRSVE